MGGTTALGGGVQADQVGALARQIGRLEPHPELLVHLGDHVWGLTGDEADLSRQWRDGWAAAAPLGTLPIHHLTGNHTSYNAVSRRIFREETASRLHPGSEPSADGLQSVWRDGDTVLVLADTTDEKTGQHGRIDWRWVDENLTRHDDAPIKIVAGHFPAFPVNGYEMPCWRIPADEAASLSKVLVRHRVAAYLCAHVIAFDVQIHEGIPQICSAGGGYPLLYPPQSEYLHFTRIGITPRRLEWQTVDVEGTVRERGQWPLECPPATTWPVLTAQGTSLPQLGDAPRQTAADGVLLLRFEGREEGAPTPSRPCSRAGTTPTRHPPSGSAFPATGSRSGSRRAAASPRCAGVERPCRRAAWRSTLRSTARSGPAACSSGAGRRSRGPLCHPNPRTVSGDWRGRSAGRPGWLTPATRARLRPPRWPCSTTTPASWSESTRSWDPSCGSARVSCPSLQRAATAPSGSSR
jgi:hypothetical protein